MLNAIKYTGVLLILMLPVALYAGTQKQADQLHNHQQGVNARGDHGMGFSHEKTKHHFRLTAEGGAIEVTANDLNDAASIELIRSHLTHIAKMFNDGDFSTPMFIHGEVPPGVPTMKSLKGAIIYTFESIDLGGRVRIATADAAAIESIHDFLRYQIKDHQTGDSTEPDKEARTGTDHTCNSMHGTCPFATGPHVDDKR